MRFWTFHHLHLRRAGFGFRVIAITPGAVKVRGLLEPTTASIKPAKVSKISIWFIVIFGYRLTHLLYQMCSFSSEAKDISSVKDMQDTLNKESSDDTTASLSLKVKGFGFDSSNQFSKVCSWPFADCLSSYIVLKSLYLWHMKEWKDEQVSARYRKWTDGFVWRCVPTSSTSVV